MKQQKR